MSAAGTELIALFLGLYLLGGGADSNDAWSRTLKDAERLASENLHSEADVHYAAALREARTLDAEGLPVAMVLNSAGYRDLLLGRVREAIRNYARAFGIFERKLPPGHRDVINVAMNLSGAYLETGQVLKAESLLRRFLPLSAELSAESRAALLGDLGSVLMQQGKLAESEQRFHEVIALLEPENNESALARRVIALSNLAVVCARSGRISDSLLHARRAQRVLAAINRPEPVLVIKTLANAAALSAAAGSPDEAERLYQEVLASCEATFGPEHYLLGQVLATYSQFLHMTRRGSEAREAAKRAKALQQQFRRDNALGFTIDAKALLEAGRSPRSGAAR